MSGLKVAALSTAVMLLGLVVVLSLQYAKVRQLDAECRAKAAELHRVGPVLERACTDNGVTR